MLAAELEEPNAKLSAAPTVKVTAEEEPSAHTLFPAAWNAGPFEGPRVSRRTMYVPERWPKNSDKVAYNEHVAGSIARRIASYSTLFGINFSLVEGQTVDVSQGFPVMGRFLLFKDTGREARLIYGSLPAIGIFTGFALRNFPLAKQGYKQMSSVVWFGGICGILLKKIKRWVGNSDKGKSAARASSLMWMA